MEQRDILAIVGAIIVVLILALVVKPMITGEDAQILPEGVISQDMISESRAPVMTSSPPAPVSTPVQTAAPVESSEDRNIVSPTLTPGPEPTKMTWQPDPDMPMPAIQMIDYADIIGKYTGTSAPFRIPTPYWEISYNVTPTGPEPAFSFDIIEKADSGEKNIRTITWKSGKIQDPKEGRFFEGGQNYYLNITAQDLKEYRIIIRIPLKYLREE